MDMQFNNHRETTMTQRIITDADRDAAKRLRAIWESKKQELKLTQIAVADEIGTSQSAISQYLNGTIALNTDAVIVFAKLLQCEPKDICPVLGSKLKINRRIPVTRSSTGAVLNKHIDAKYIGDTPQAVLVDEMSYYPRIKQGEYVIIDPTGDIISGTEILMETIDSGFVIRTFDNEIPEGYAVRNILTERPLVVLRENVISMNPIVAVSNGF